MEAPQPSFWRQLLEGATRPSGAGLLGTLGITALLMVLTAVLLRPGGLADHRWVAEPIDDFAWMAGNVVRYQQGSPEAFHLAVVGTSATREALSDGASLQAELSALMDRPVEVHMLLAGSLYPLEFLVVADHVPPGVPGMVVVEVSERNLGLEPHTWHWLARNPRLPLHSPSYRSRAAAAGHPPRLMIPGVYLSEHVDFYAGRIFPRVMQRFEPIPYHLHPVDALGPPSEHEWGIMQSHYESYLRVYDAFQDQVVPIYEQIVATVHQRSASRVAFLQAPRNPRFTEMMQERSQPNRMLADRYQAHVQQLAQDLGVPYWDIRGPAQIQPESFRDHTHIADPAARTRFTRALAEAVAAAAQEQGL